MTYIHASPSSQSSVSGWSASIVLYQPDLNRLAETLTSLTVAVRALRGRYGETPFMLVVVDNGNTPDFAFLQERLKAARIDIQIISGQGNVGYGCGHDLALSCIASQYHIILNPDVELAPDALVHAHMFFDAYPDAGLLAPCVADEWGTVQFLCRRFPTVLDLFVRGFVPRRWHRLFARRLAHYEMRDVINGLDIVWDPPIVSGCFMLFRTGVLKLLGGFDSRYFLYFEDYDLSLRAHKVTRVAYVPSVKIVHHGGGAARKGWLHIKLFVLSAVKFYRRFGWKWA
ncbi:glycosyltransferase [Mycetohabitans endofungorum]|uniref:glycosyltransferase n=1 Tax=Mycetohabitans endofungorum TaxID=417203 RepID=UPI0030CA9D93